MARKMHTPLAWRALHLKRQLLAAPNSATERLALEPKLAKTTSYAYTYTRAKLDKGATADSILNTWVLLHPLAFDATSFYNRQALPRLWLAEYLIQFRFHALGPVHALQQMIILPCTSTLNTQKLQSVHEMKRT